MTFAKASKRTIATKEWYTITTKRKPPINTNKDIKHHNSAYAKYTHMNTKDDMPSTGPNNPFTVGPLKCNISDKQDENLKTSITYNVQGPKREYEKIP